MKNTDWVKWSSIAEITSSFAIVITLIYLAIQTNQNSRALLANSRDVVLSNDLEIIGQLMDHPEVDVGYDHGFHTYEDAEAGESWLIEFSRTREHHWFQLQEGIIDEQTWNSYANGFAAVLSTPLTRAWWEYRGPAFFDGEFVEEVNWILENTPIETSEVPVLIMLQERIGLVPQTGNPD